MKTIMDAVNDLRADLNNSYFFCGNETNIIYDHDEPGFIAMIPEYSDKRIRDNTDESADFVCTVEEFTALVKECENNFGE